MLSYCGRISKWIENFQTLGPSKPRLFCLPFAGGNSTSFRVLANRLAPTIETCAIELPGRLRRIGEVPIRCLDELVREIIREVGPLFAERPFVVLGYSMGALVGFELLRSLQLQYEIQPRRFFAAARVAPSSRSQTKINELPIGKFLKAIELKYGFVQPMLLENEELQRLIEPALRADFSIFENYDYHQVLPLSCPITVLFGKQDPEPMSRIEGWRFESAASCDFRFFDGGHFFLPGNEEPIAVLIEQAFLPT